MSLHSETADFPQMTVVINPKTVILEKMIHIHHSNLRCTTTNYTYSSITPSALALSILPSGCLIGPMRARPTPPTTRHGVLGALLSGPITAPRSRSVVGVGFICQASSVLWLLVCSWV